MGVSREAVTWGYRFFLGREPESEAVISSHLLARDTTHLAQMLMGSAEFAARRRNFGPRGPARALEVVHLDIDSLATPLEITACLEKIKAAWSHLGAVEPHYSVLTNARFRPAALPGALDDFWHSGQSEAERFVRTLAAHTFSFAGKTCMEYGCGVGRVTSGLSRAFARVEAYDISAAHLDLARARVRDLGITNVRFHECSANTLDVLEPCDVFYSRLVFQHNPPPVIAELIRQALGALRPEGIAVFQVPTYMGGYSFKLPEWLKTE
jgi:hypothetical protein